MATVTAAKGCPFSNASIDFDPFDITDPFAFYEWARAEAPVFFSEELQYYVVAGHADIKSVFEDWRTFSSENAQAPLRPIGEGGKRIMREGGFTAYSGLSARVPPDHTRIRKLVQGCFGPRRFKAIEPQIRQIVTHALDAIIANGKAEFVREFAYDVPAFVLFKLVGVPDADVVKVKAWAVSRALLTWGNLSDAEQLPHARNMVEYWNYCRALVAQRHVSPSDDLPGDLVRLQKEGAEISDDEIAGVLYSVLFAGHETTTTLIANGLRELLLHRRNWEALVANPALIAGAVDEILRFSPSIVAWRRRALKDAEIGGVAIPEGADISVAARLRQSRRGGVLRAIAPRHHAHGFARPSCLRLWNPLLRRPATGQDGACHRAGRTDAANTRREAEGEPDLRLRARHLIPYSHRTSH